ncbi:DUF692 domain-containing protein [Anabaena cylindrica FACHB-243]|uniref:DUF692 domain-containing protein n=1 Tax=Anabaena cylindrica (strain ATCC 27899 / PCC 7122) TaxID=272123 RepID=K9ZMJ3_ANACC|nr:MULTISPECIES: DUF692 domain-containing protein [Anabaena]AFZ59545.1 protein of unknown function DUF692 [Anabaena cylindrica PCC 7122]MBD2418789.1 DUF692 domain-containing protein [Anabaena cylindrica FACHB-243]MBY5284775.1 DUF692 domain-containing protein [Anabaena sp. CCAP 1446/1C]MBY5310158.1 DUF692 domain-containing protein [Anabaena sp. CCAP 1446/1C]MCM2406354.1 DUF692 domain-containing protein [Anabaena sp. CCAP 1446/1C]
MLSHLPNLGVGLGFRQPFKSDLFLNRQQVDFLEIVAEHYLDAAPEKQQELEILAAHFPIIPHAINLSLGSAEGLDRDYLRKLAALIQQLNPPWWSEHICFTKAGGIDIGHLSPLPYTQEAVDVLCRNIAEVRRWVDVPLILENITYMVQLPGAEMTEAQFLSEVLERSDCGLLLDITNLHTNAVNYGYDVDEFLQELPWERVVQLHFVGGHWHDNILIDSHSQSTPVEVWELMKKVITRASVKGIVLERDENLPIFAELAGELQQAREIIRSYGKWDY